MNGLGVRAANEAVSPSVVELRKPRESDERYAAARTYEASDMVPRLHGEEP